MHPTATRALLKLHRWTGLLAAANLSILVATGVLLLFEPEIEDLAGIASVSEAAASATLAQAVELARATAPGEALVITRSFADYPGIVFVGMSVTGTIEDASAVAVDVSRATVVATPAHDNSFFGIVWRLHTELLAGAKGTTLIGCIAVLLAVSLITGGVIYVPMMRGFDLRRRRPFRAFIADLHKVTGISVLAWGLVVATTGIILAWGVPKARAHGAQMVLGRGPVQVDLSGLDDAVHAAEATRLKGRWWTIVLPHDDGRYGVVMRGGPGLGKRVITVAQVEGTTVLSSQPIAEGVFRLGPIHFAEFGGLAVRIVWALFAIGLLGLTVSGPFMRAARF